MQNNTLVSCVIPVFNGERFLAEAIDSVLAQTYDRVEIIVVDDGSTDATRTVAESYVPRVSYVHQCNTGPSSARNAGVQRAAGAVIAFLDSDDIWRAEKLAIQMKYFDARADLAICTAYMHNFWSADLGAERDSTDATTLIADQPNLGSTFMARRALFEAIGLLDPSLKHRDLHEFVLRATDAGYAVQALQDVLVDRRIHDANMSRDRNSGGEFELIAIARARIARRGMRRA